MPTQVEKQEQRSTTGGASAAPQAASQSAIKKDLRGRSYDEQVQMLSPDKAGQGPEAPAAPGAPEGAAPDEKGASPAPTKDEKPEGGGKAEPQKSPAEAVAASKDGAAGDKAQEAPKEMSEGDKLRASVAGQAKQWDGKEFMSQEEIEKTRETTGLKNYTTCIDFAGKMMREGTKEMYGKDWKKATQTSAMLSQVKADWEKAVGERIQQASYTKSVATFDKAIADMQAKKDKLQVQIDDLSRAQDEGEKEILYKQRLIRAKALGTQMKAFDGVISQLTKQRDGFQAKADKAGGKAQDIDAKNTAMVKAADGMTNGRPKEGEYIILSQAPGGGDYGVSKETKVQLAGGAFKHIAIFMGVEKEDDGSGVETWTTIDGGGTKGKTTKLFVRLKDRMVFPAYQGAHAPEAGSASKSQIAGWIDMNELVKMRDEKAAAKNK